MHNLFNILLTKNVNLFYFINSGLDNSFLDYSMVFITNFGSVVAWGLVCVLLFVFGGEKAKKVAILCLIALLVTNIAVALLKYLIAEPRPFLTLSNVELLVPENEIYSFPSGHASSSFAAATVIGMKYGLKIKGKCVKFIYPLLIFASIIAFSRIYIGVHYPLDVIVGAIIGIIFGLVVLKLEKPLLSNKLTHLIGLDRILKGNILNKIKNRI